MLDSINVDTLTVDQIRNEIIRFKNNVFSQVSIKSSLHGLSIITNRKCSL